MKFLHLIVSGLAGSKGVKPNFVKANIIWCLFNEQLDNIWAYFIFQNLLFWHEKGHSHPVYTFLVLDQIHFIFSLQIKWISKYLCIRSCCKKFARRKFFQYCPFCLTFLLKYRIKKFSDKIFITKQEFCQFCPTKSCPVRYFNSFCHYKSQFHSCAV